MANRLTSTTPESSAARATELKPAPGQGADSQHTTVGKCTSGYAVNDARARAASRYRPAIAD